MTAPTMPGVEFSASVDSLLDGGTRGLLYFERHLPTLHRIDDSREWTYAEMCARYDEQRGLDIAALTADADALGSVLEVARSQIEEQRRLCAVLARSWSGPAGEAAMSDMESDLQRALSRVDSIDQLYQSMHTAADVIGEIVRDKASVVGSIDFSRVGGKPIESIDAIAYFAGLDPDSVQSIGPVANAFLAAVEAALPEVAEVVDTRTPLDSVGLSKVRRVCDAWLNDVFRPTVIETCLAFVEICTATDTGVRDLLAVVANTAEAIDDSEFPSTDIDDSAVDRPDPRCRTAPDGLPESAPGTVPQSTLPLPALPPPVLPPPVLPQSAQLQSAIPQQALPTAAPATSSMPESQPQRSPDIDTGSHTGPSGSAGSPDSAAAIESAVQRVMEPLTADIRSALDHILDSESGETPTPPNGREEQFSSNDSVQDQDSLSSAEPPKADAEPVNDDTPPPAADTAEPDSGGVSPERGHLEAELDGHSAKIAVAQNRTVSLELGSPDGGVRRFELRMGPLGLPVIVETLEAPPVAFGSAPEQAIPEQAIPEQGDPDRPASESNVEQPEEVPEPEPIAPGLGTSEDSEPEDFEPAVCTPDEGEAAPIGPPIRTPSQPPTPAEGPAPSAADQDAEGPSLDSGAHLAEAGPL
ncbi:hypothetical protein E5720_03895 [Rhodococcus sp. PAMC28707]|uniref:hypothetical protein n=1 Tax=unclassified Rhodococcus (in: high G+C Gram-positive bacteria) TaxID=192944 RepID=UPI00109E3551|nr:MULTISPECIES: hypothetical protein [unclassified Rhodococcus (in: high G+C Gram-positive bacteria)]QCB50554.1 hypothetical protein E5769_10120 [Rhodococcus sp. PAMC28705]QCB57754.1 hypothetical protein E5720_03895 [Rhodococcus sp. PAMC28707]